MDFIHRIGREQDKALESLATTGHLPSDPFWDALKARHDAHPTRFDHSRPVVGALIERDEAGDPSSLLLPHTPYFDRLKLKHDHGKPVGHFLGKLFDLEERPITAAGEGFIPPLPVAGVGAAGGTNAGSTNSLGGGTGVGSITPLAVPSPPGSVLGLSGMAIVGVWLWRGRRASRIMGGAGFEPATSTV